MNHPPYAPNLVRFAQALVTIIDCVDDIISCCNEAVDRIYTHQLQYCNGCTNPPPIDAPPNSITNCRNRIPLVSGSEVLSRAVSSMTILELTRLEVMEREVATLNEGRSRALIESGGQPSYASVETDSNMSHILLELRSTFEYVDKFLFSTYIKQRVQIVQMKLIFKTLPYFDTELYLAPSFVDTLERFDILSSFYILYETLHPTYDNFLALRGPVYGKYLTLERMKILFSFYIPRPNFSPI